MKRKSFYITCSIAISILLLSTITGWIKKPIDPADIKKSAAKSILLLQESTYTFTNNAFGNCASCHHNALTSVVAELAVKKGIAVVDSFTTKRVHSIVKTLAEQCNPNLINQLIPANFFPSYFLFGLNAENYKPDFNTDMTVDYLITQAKPDGSFLTDAGRPPLGSGEAHLAALAVHAIQLYAAPSKRKKVEEIVERTRNWFQKLNTDNLQELSFQLLGMHWCNSDKNVKLDIAKKLKAMQNADGGWSQLQGTGSDAYATGEALYALFESGSIRAKDAIYQQGLSYLLKTQDKAGAWIVATRAYAVQPFISSQFPPYDENQFISATASNWATIALLNALPDNKKLV